MLDPEAIRKKLEQVEEYRRILQIEIAKEYGHSEWQLVKSWDTIRDKEYKDICKAIRRSKFYKAVINSMNEHIPEFQKKLRQLGNSSIIIDELITYLDGESN